MIAINQYNYFWNRSSTSLGTDNLPWEDLKSIDYASLGIGATGVALSSLVSELGKSFVLNTRMNTLIGSNNAVKMALLSGLTGAAKLTRPQAIGLFFLGATLFHGAHRLWSYKVDGIGWEGVAPELENYLYTIGMFAFTGFAGKGAGMALAQTAPWLKMVGALGTEFAAFTLWEGAEGVGRLAVRNNLTTGNIKHALTHPFTFKASIERALFMGALKVAHPVSSGVQKVVDGKNWSAQGIERAVGRFGEWQQAHPAQARMAVGTALGLGGLAVLGPDGLSAAGLPLLGMVEGKKGNTIPPTTVMELVHKLIEDPNQYTDEQIRGLDISMEDCFRLEGDQRYIDHNALGLKELNTEQEVNVLMTLARIAEIRGDHVLVNALRSNSTYMSNPLYHVYHQSDRPRYYLLNLDNTIRRLKSGVIMNEAHSVEEALVLASIDIYDMKKEGVLLPAVSEAYKEHIRIGIQHYMNDLFQRGYDSRTIVKEFFPRLENLLYYAQLDIPLPDPKLVRTHVVKARQLGKKIIELKRSGESIELARALREQAHELILAGNYQEAARVLMEAMDTYQKISLPFWEWEEKNKKYVYPTVYWSFAEALEKNGNHLHAAKLYERLADEKIYNSDEEEKKFTALNQAAKAYATGGHVENAEKAYSRLVSYCHEQQQKSEGIRDYLREDSYDRQDAISKLWKERAKIAQHVLLEIKYPDPEATYQSLLGRLQTEKQNRGKEVEKAYDELLDFCRAFRDLAQDNTRRQLWNDRCRKAIHIFV